MILSSLKQKEITFLNVIQLPKPGVLGPDC